MVPRLIFEVLPALSDLQMSTVRVILNTSLDRVVGASEDSICMALVGVAS